jgi:PKD repeat protein
VTITRSGLVNADYHWRYRAKDIKGAASDWTEFGTAGNIDFSVSVTYQPPIADFTYSPLKPLIGEEITFNASASFDPDGGNIVSYEWNFGDGSTAYGEIPLPHSYSVARDYTVTLTVTDDEGTTNSKSMTVKVTKDWNFVIITDLHIGYGFPDYGTSSWNDSGGQDWLGDSPYWLTKRLRGIVNWINEHEESDNIHFVVVLGDISDSGEKSELLKARDILNGLNVPYIPVIGNHDIWPYTQEEKGRNWRDIRDKCIKEYATTAIGDEFFYEVFWRQNSENVQKIKELFGNSFATQTEEIESLCMNYAFVYKGIKFIALDFVDRNPDPKKAPQSEGPKLNPDTRQWLTVKLNENVALPTILLSHHPMWVGPGGFNPSDLLAIRTIISGKNILANFAGHVHYDKFLEDWSNWEAGIDVVTTEAVCRESCIAGVDRTGDNIRIVTMSGEKIEKWDTLYSIGDETQETGWERFLKSWKFWVRSPVDVAVTDPEGFTITKEIGEVSGMFYVEFDWDGDDKIDEMIIIDEVKVGDYQITVIPESGASPTDMYTLLVWGQDAAIVLAENVSISDIPAEPYIVSSTAFTLNVPPTTLLDVGEPKCVVDGVTYLTSATLIELIAHDNPYGSGLSSTAYRIYNATYDTGWITYMQPIYLTGLTDGAYCIDYYSVDFLNNTESTNTITVILDNTPPEASFTWTPSIPKVGETVTFDASASTSNGVTIVSYEWDFGDGGHANGKIVTHTYTTAGTYTVTLNVTDSLGFWDIEQKQIQIEALPPPPLSASISPLSASILVGQSVTFTSTVSGGYTPYSYQWFLNGNPVSGATSASWTFIPTSSGIYYVHLKVTDDKGNTAQSGAARITVATVPVGGYSIPMQLPATAKPVTMHIALLTILTAIFITIKRKTKRKH